MQNRPENWGLLFEGPHLTEYIFQINGVNYTRENLAKAPSLVKPLMDKPAIGRCCSGTLTLSLRVSASVTIPKAAPVVMKVRLTSKDGETVTPWVEKGHFLIAGRKRSGDILQLTCRDKMLMSGTTYADKTAITEWPASMAAVVAEIAQIMGVAVDTRMTIKSGSDFIVDRPSDDTLISEVLSTIAAAHFGNWVMSDTGKLWLTPFPNTGNSVQYVGSNYQKYSPISSVQKITRLTLEDSAGNQFTSGNDTGYELAAKCESATQSIVDGIMAQYTAVAKIENGAVVVVGELKDALESVSMQNGVASFNTSTVAGPEFVPYTLNGAYLDPLIEVGDTVTITRKGVPVKLIIASLSATCGVNFIGNISFNMEIEDEDEFPYTDAQTLEVSRAVSTHKSYYGNKFNRESGFVSERVVDGVVTAKLTANADTFTMQQLVNGEWKDRIYFDPVKMKYIITGEVEVTGAVTVSDLSETQSSTFINGSNIITGTLAANKITTGSLTSKDGSIVFDLDKNTLTIGEDDVEKAIAKIDNQVSIEASSQMFIREDGAEAYSPAKITLKAETRGSLSSFQWYKNDSILSGKTTDTLEVLPTDFIEATAKYSVSCSDSLGNTYTAFVSLAKLTGGEQGADGYNTATVFLYKRSSSAPTIDWDGSLKYLFENPPHLESIPTGWYKSISDIPATNTNPLYVTTATAYSNISYDFIEKTEWSQPILLVANGEDGDPGYTTAIVNLYKRASSKPDIDWAGYLTYSFFEKKITSIPTGWHDTIPDDTDDPLYITSAVAFSNKDTVELPVDAWSDPAKMAENGSPGTPGTPGAAGLGISTIAEYYAASTSKSTAPSTWVTTVPSLTATKRYLWNYELITYTNGSTHETEKRVIGVYGDTGSPGTPGAAGDAGRGIQSITNYYLASASDTGVTRETQGWTTATQAISADNPYLWNYEAITYDDGSAPYYSDPCIIGRYGSDGEDGTDGTDGTNGYNTATVFLYKRSSSAPAKPSSDLTYTFATGTLSGSLGGWSATIPGIDGNPCYVIQATAKSQSATYTVIPDDWSAQVKMVEDGYNTATVFLYQRKNETPSKPSGNLTYTFATGALSGTLGDWKQTIPGNDGNPCYVIQASAISPGSTFTIQSGGWSSPALLVENGSPGTPGAAGQDGYTVLLSQEYITVNVSIDVNGNRLPTVNEDFSVVVSCYKGLTPLTATAGTPTDGKFKVTVKNTVTGVTVSHATAGTLTLTVQETTAISDTGVLLIEITTADGMAIEKRITIQANMNSVVATHNATIETLESSITSKVEETIYHTQVPVYASSDPSTGWTPEQKTANTGYLWYDTANSVLKKWTGAAWSTGASVGTFAEHTESVMTQTAGKLSWIVKSGTSESNFEMTDRAMALATGSLNLQTSDMYEDDDTRTFDKYSISGASDFSDTTVDGVRWWVSTNHDDKTCSVCKFSVTMLKDGEIYFKAFCDAENRGSNYWDYGIIGKIDKTLSTAWNASESDSVYKNVFNTDSPIDVVMPVSAGTHYFYVKYRKDDSNTDQPDIFKISHPKARYYLAGTTLSIRSGSSVLSSTNITLKGIVTMTDLSGSGSTIINGDNIKTGTITGIKILSRKNVGSDHAGNFYWRNTEMNAGEVSFYIDRRDNTTEELVQTYNIGSLSPGYKDESSTFTPWLELNSYDGNGIRINSADNMYLTVTGNNQIVLGPKEDASSDSAKVYLISGVSGEIALIGTTVMNVGNAGSRSYGSAGQVLMSGGSNSSVYWGTVSSGANVTVLSSSSGWTTIYHNATSNGYKAIVVIGRTTSSGSRLSCTIPVALMTGLKFQMCDETYYMNFNAYGDYIACSQRSNSGATIDYIYGIK